MSCPAILIVDDNPSNVELMEATLAADLYDVKIAMEPRRRSRSSKHLNRI